MCRKTPLSVSLSGVVVSKSDGKLNLFTNKKNRVRIPWSSTDGRADGDFSRLVRKVRASQGRVPDNVRWR